jgi:hypothetical protein
LARRAQGASSSVRTPSAAWLRRSRTTWRYTYIKCRWSQGIVAQLHQRVRIFAWCGCWAIQMPCPEAFTRRSGPKLKSLAASVSDAWRLRL